MLTIVPPTDISDDEFPEHTIKSTVNNWTEGTWKGMAGDKFEIPAWQRRSGVPKPVNVILPEDPSYEGRFDPEFLIPASSSPSNLQFHKDIRNKNSEPVFSEPRSGRRKLSSSASATEEHGHNRGYLSARTQLSGRRRLRTRVPSVSGCPSSKWPDVDDLFPKEASSRNASRTEVTGFPQLVGGRLRPHKTPSCENARNSFGQGITDINFSPGPYGSHHDSDFHLCHGDHHHHHHHQNRLLQRRRQSSSSSCTSIDLQNRSVTRARNSSSLFPLPVARRENPITPVTATSSSCCNHWSLVCSRGHPRIKSKNPCRPTSRLSDILLPTFIHPVCNTKKRSCHSDTNLRQPSANNTIRPTTYICSKNSPVQNALKKNESSTHFIRNWSAESENAVEEESISPRHNFCSSLFSTPSASTSTSSVDSSCMLPLEILRSRPPVEDVLENLPYLRPIRSTIKCKATEMPRIVTEVVESRISLTSISSDSSSRRDFSMSNNDKDDGFLYEDSATFTAEADCERIIHKLDLLLGTNSREHAEEDHEFVEIRTQNTENTEVKQESRGSSDSEEEVTEERIELNMEEERNQSNNDEETHETNVEILEGIHAQFDQEADNEEEQKEGEFEPPQKTEDEIVGENADDIQCEDIKENQDSPSENQWEDPIGVEQNVPEDRGIDVGNTKEDLITECVRLEKDEHAPTQIVSFPSKESPLENSSVIIIEVEEGQEEDIRKEDAKMRIEKCIEVEEEPKFPEKNDKPIHPPVERPSPTPQFSFLSSGALDDIEPSKITKLELDPLRAVRIPSFVLVSSSTPPPEKSSRMLEEVSNIQLNFELKPLWEKKLVNVRGQHVPGGSEGHSHRRSFTNNPNPVDLSPQNNFVSSSSSDYYNDPYHDNLRRPPKGQAEELLAYRDPTASAFLRRQQQQQEEILTEFLPYCHFVRLCEATVHPADGESHKPFIQSTADVMLPCHSVSLRISPTTSSTNSLVPSLRSQKGSRSTRGFYRCMSFFCRRNNSHLNTCICKPFRFFFPSCCYAKRRRRRRSSKEPHTTF